MESNRYNEYDWYAPRREEPKTEEPETEAQYQYEERYEPPKRRRNGGRIVGALLILAVLVAGAIYASSKVKRSFNVIWKNGKDSGGFYWDGDFNTEIPWLDDGGQTELPDSAEEFFDNYFQTDDNTDLVSEIHIPTVEYTGDFEIKLNDAAGEEKTLGQLYEDCASSIVAIYAYPENEESFYWGTGIVLSEDGLILTNTHIIEGTLRATVKLADNAEYEAMLVGADAISDLALLKIEAAGLKPASFGQSSAMRVGDPVAAIGNPLGEEFRLTLTNGIISAIDRGVNYKSRSMTLLQTNTALNSGNSGGALFNMRGQVVGVTNMKMMSSYSSIEGIGFAIPSTTVQNVVKSLIRYGKVLGRPSIGVTVGSIPERAREEYGMPEGVYVEGVQEKSDAALKGVRKGDVITEVNYIPVKTADEINAIKNTLAVNDIMIFKIWRDGEYLEIEVTLMDTNDVY